MLTQAETRLYVDLHNREHPQAVFDMHQMGRRGVRFMVPPFIDPLDPNQDPVIQQGFAALGSHIGPAHDQGHGWCRHECDLR